MKLTLLCTTIALAALTGCQGSPSQTMGKAPVEGAGPIVPVSQIKLVSVKPEDSKKLPAATPIVVRGTMIEKCPISGCWFMLKDKTGVIKIDTKNAGFVVSDLALNTEITVLGIPASSGEACITASGIRY